MATKKKTAKTTKKSPTTAKAKSGGISKSDFIRANPDLSAKDLVVKAKDAGITLAPILVYKVRGRARAKGPKAAKGTAGPKAAIKPGPTSKDGKITGADFVRQHPDKKAAEIVALAKKAGVKVTDGLVYQTRAYDKKKTGTATTAKKKPGPKPKTQYQTPKFVAFPGGGDETDLKKAALAVGFPRALQVIQELAKKAEAVQRQYQALLG